MTLFHRSSQRTVFRDDMADAFPIPSGEHTKNTWNIAMFKWPFSIAMLVYQVFPGAQILGL